MGAYTGDTSKQVQTIAVSLELPIVAQADILDETHPVNQSHLSGKQLGARVLMATDGDPTVCVPVCATGSADVDGWVYADGSAVTNPI